jgi:hypothetical protein
MATSHSSAMPAGQGQMDSAEKRLGWQTFLKIAKWSSLVILGITFFLIIWLIGHAPLVPTVLIIALVVYGLGALFH